MGAANQLLVYVAGPYSASTAERRERNVEAAVDAGVALFQRGHFPYIPHLTHFVDLRAKQTGITLEWEDYISWDLPWLERCDALLYLGSSKGADLELRFCQGTREEDLLLDRGCAGGSSDQRNHLPSWMRSASR